MNSQAVRDERAAFEAWYAPKFAGNCVANMPLRANGEYLKAQAEIAWRAWKGRAALAASVPVSQEPAHLDALKLIRETAHKGIGQPRKYGPAALLEIDAICAKVISAPPENFARIVAAHPAAQSLPEPEPVSNQISYSKSSNNSIPIFDEWRPLPEHLAAPSLLPARDSTESDRLPRGPGTPGQSPAAKAAAEAVHRWAAEMGTNAPAWVARKAELDFYDDGHGLGVTHGGRKTYGTEFLVWAREHLGQGYSLAIDEGAFVDNVTAYCHRGYVAGKESMAQAEPSQQGCVPPAEASGSDSQSAVSVPLPEASGHPATKGAL